MIIFPAIDLYEGKAVRLFKGDYEQMTIYSLHPEEIALDFKKAGATFIHVVDLEGAKSGACPNLEIILKIKEVSGLKVEVGGGIRSLQTIDQYLNSGIDRVILGTAAINDEELLRNALKKYGDRIAVGADIKDGYIAIKGWLEKSEVSVDDFFKKMEEMGVKTIICTDISKDGAMKGTNRLLYKELSEKYHLDIAASGGVSNIDDIKALRDLNLYGAIIGKAYYIGTIDLKEAIRYSL